MLLKILYSNRTLLVYIIRKEFSVKSVLPTQTHHQCRCHKKNETAQYVLIRKKPRSKKAWSTVYVLHHHLYENTQNNKIHKRILKKQCFWE